MPTRYDDREVFLNDNDLYDNLFEERNVNSIRHYDTPKMSYPTTGDRYFKLAIQYYGSAQYWWVIAMFNQKPTEADLTVGELIYIPTPLQDVLRYYNR